MADDIQKTRVHMIAIVVSDEDLVVKGYYPTWNVTRRADVASANTLNTTTLDPCAAYYYVNATGIDGHVKGLTTKTTKYITPYGKLYDAIQTGGSWTSVTGKTYGPFKGDWAKQTDRVNEVKEARDVSCAETQKMTIQYNLGDSVDGGQESTEGSSPSVTLKSKDEFTKAYAKGGIYKVTKQARNATITVKTTTVKYYLRDSARVDFTGWKECKKDQTINASDMISNIGRLEGLTGSNAFNLGALKKWNDNKCGYIGNTKPNFDQDSIAKAYKWDDVGKWLNPGANGTIGLWYGNYGQNDGWMLSNNQDRTETEVKALSANGGNEITMNTGNNKYVVGKAFNRGYPTKWNCGGKIFTSDQLGKDVDPGSCSIESINDFKFTNEVLGEYVRENGNVIWKWKAGGKEAFFQGSALKNSTGLGILNNALAPVSNSLQSIIAVAYQDFVNINCNQKDFEALINSLRDQQIANGIPQDQAISVVSSTKFNGTAQTGVITKDIVPSLAEIVPRALGSTMMNGKTINGLGIEQVTGKDNPVIDGQAWTTYRGINGKYNVGYNAEKDPVYSKECPLDCVADSRQNDTAKSNVLSNGASQDDIAKGATGVKAQPSTSDGSLGSPVNTANMQFFRNNEWNQFKVDLYTPVVGGTAPGQVSYDGRAAKSTVINRNDGTPWFSTNGTVLTEMQASRAGSWTPIFNVANKAAAEIKDAPTQTQYGMTTTGTDRAFHVQLAGQVNDFRIKSSWATENGNPLKFQFKWEYDVQNHVNVPDNVSFHGTGTPNGNDTTVNLKTVSTGVDGKCLSQQNTKLPSPDTTELNHASSGSGTQNTDDRQFSGPGLGIDQRGWISVTFVRAAGE